MNRPRVAVIGVGHLGKEHARILSTLQDVALAGVVDARFEQAELVAERCHSLAYSDHRAIPGRLDAAVIAVPTVHHHAVACDLLQRGVALLIEKPLAATLADADEITDLAHSKGLVLQVGHIERFNPAFEALQARPLRPLMISCQRYSPFTGRSQDIGVVLDLMIHDIDLALTLVNSPVRHVTALGMSLLGGHEDVAQAMLTFANGCVAHLSASRVHTGPHREMQVWAAEGYAGIDLQQRRLTLVQKSELLRASLQKTECDCNAAGPDQLTRELQEFVAAVRTGSPVRVDGYAGRDAIAVATRILDSAAVHRWDDSLAGPSSLPSPIGVLFPPTGFRAAA